MTPWVLPLSSESRRLEYYAQFLDDERLSPEERAQIARHLNYLLGAGEADPDQARQHFLPFGRISARRKRRPARRRGLRSTAHPPGRADAAFDGPRGRISAAAAGGILLSQAGIGRFRDRYALTTLAIKARCASYILDQIKGYSDGGE